MSMCVRQQGLTNKGDRGGGYIMALEPNCWRFSTALLFSSYMSLFSNSLDLYFLICKRGIIVST